MWELYINSISSDIDGERCASDLAGGEACASRWVWRSVGIDDRSRGSRNHENHKKNMIFRPEIGFLEIAPNVTMDFSQASPTLPGLGNVSIERWNVPDDITWRHGWGGKSLTKVKKSSKITKKCHKSKPKT